MKGHGLRQLSLALWALAFLAAGCSSSPSAATTTLAAASSARALVSPHSTLTTANPAPTAPSSVAPSAAASPPPIPDGTYITGEFARADALAALKAAGVPINARTKPFVTAIPPSMSWRMRIYRGHITRWCTTTGQVEVGCDEGTFAFPDAHTMIVQPPDGACVTTLSMRWAPPRITLKQLKTTCGVEDLVVGAFSFGTNPWTLEP